MNKFGNDNKKIKSVLAAMTGSLLLSGCATMSQNEPQLEHHSYQTGYQDAIAGLPVNWRNNYYVVIGNRPQNFDENEYLRGFELGRIELKPKQKVVTQPE